MLLCLDPPAGEPALACGRCESCRLLDGPPAEAGDRHPDLHVVTKELSRFSDDASTRNRKLTSIPVEVLREHLLEPAHRSPQLGSRKIFVLDEAELLNPAGQNVLLKTLEEPPPGTFLILVTSSGERLLPTVRSRCQRVGFQPLPDATVGDWITRNHPDLDAPTRGWVTRFADGSLGRAGLALDRGLVSWSDRLGPLLDAAAAGRAVPELTDAGNEAIKGFAEGWVKEFPQASKEAANRLAAGLLAHLFAARSPHPPGGRRPRLPRRRSPRQRAARRGSARRHRRRRRVPRADGEQREPVAGGGGAGLGYAAAWRNPA